MMPMTIAQVAQAVGGRLAAPEGSAGDAVCTSACTDSRQVGRQGVFVAIRGERVDGHAFVGSAASKGASAAIVEHEVEMGAQAAAIPQIVVDDSVRALGELARRNIELRRSLASAEGGAFTLIGLTGSVGKTTTKDLLASLLGHVGQTVAPVGSFNNNIGLPLTALKVGPQTRYFVAEMGANHVGEIAALTRIAPPDVALVLKVGVAHLGEFGSVERIAEAKSEIVRGLVPSGRTILNADDAHVAAMAALAPGEVDWFGVDPANAGKDLLTAVDIVTDDTDRPAFTLCAADGERAEVRLSIRGRHNAMNALAAATVALTEGMSLTDIARILGEQRTISPHRMAVSTVTRDGATFTLIDDSFNANPDSMRAGLDGLARWGAGRGGMDGADRAAGPFRIAVLGAMLELGPDEAALHASIGAYAASLGVDRIIAVGSPDDATLDSLAQDLAQGARDHRDARTVVEVAHDIDRADALVTGLAREHPGSVVLLKGSHASGLSALAARWQTPQDAPDGARTEGSER